ncbi:hypothetical protein H072_4867 [Dactylellina haptotyla CBS 200.50]|uniref:Ubiquitin-like domain-containing protein n=1 Tax=Dactylellina haptotyla (strain CBS 200.50) TaxID=1284197 RepID=S8C0U1_DACHA|nr:hypothetical protein H072_4867 [Dactylellina haptotyla CBS 200.50]
MASTSPATAAPSQPGTKSVMIKVMNPGVKEPQLISRVAALTSTVRDLKEDIRSATSAQSDPDPHRLRLIYQGKQLTDDMVLGQVFQNSSEDPIHLHLVVRPNPESTTTTTTTTTTAPARSIFSSLPGSSSNTPRTATPNQTTSHPPSVPPSQPSVSSTTTPQIPATGPIPPPGPHELPPAEPVYITGLPPNTHIISYNRQVVVTTHGQIFRRPGAPPPEPAVPGVPNANAVNVTLNTLDGELRPVDPPTPNQASTTPSSANGPPGFRSADPQVIIRTNQGPVVHTQTHTFRFTRSQPTPGSTPQPGLPQTGLPQPGATQPGFPQPGFHQPGFPPTGFPPGFPPGFHQPAFANAYSTAHSFGLPRLGNMPMASFPGPMPASNPQPQYYLLQGPEGQSSLLLSSNPASSPNPWAFQPPRISPLAPTGTHLSPPPGLNLNDASSVTVPDGDGNRQADFLQREAALRAEIEEMHQRNVQRMALLDENRRQILRMQAQAQAQQVLTHRNVPQPQAEAAAAAARGPVPRPQNHPLLPQGPINRAMDMMLWAIGGGNPNAPAPTAQLIEEALRWFFDNIWLALKLAFAVYLLGGGRDFRRDALLWGAATVIFIWQSGIFDVWLRPLMRQINEWIPDPNRPPPAQAPGQPAPAPQVGIPNVQEAANRWIQQHRGRQGGGILDTIQNSVSIFLASLVPGLGERIGNARAAEIERQRRAIEDAQAAAQAAQGEVAEGAAAAPAEGVAQPPAEQPAQAPGPQNEDVVNAARDHFGDERARELFGPQANGEEPQAMFGF